MKHRELAKAILKDVGGEDNILSFTHCLTRLRFELKNPDKADTIHLKKLRGVRGVITHRGKYMVVIGLGVADVYRAIRTIAPDDKRKLKAQRPKRQRTCFAEVLLYLVLILGAVAALTEVSSIWGLLYTNERIQKTIKEVAEFGLYTVPIIYWKVLTGRKSESGEVDKRVIYAPVKGKVTELPARMTQEVEKGVVIIPESDLFVSPADGKVESISRSFDSILIQADSGIEIMIKIGEDGADSEGKFFKLFVAEGERVRVGDPLVEVNKDALEINGFDLTTIIGIRNYERYGRPRLVAEIAQEQRPLIEIYRDKNEME